MNTRTKLLSRARGFSLIEVLVVIAIILIIAAIAIPNLLKSRMRANEASAVASLRVIATAEISYQSRYDQGFSADLASLGPPAAGSQASASAADLIDSSLASGTRSGYRFIYAASDTNSDGKRDGFTVNGNPISPGQTGERYFYVDQTGVLRWAIGGPANASSEPVPTK